MTEAENKLSRPLEHVSVEGKEVYLLGTAHLSAESVEDVRKAVETVKPDTICIELCPARHKALTQGDSWQKMNIFKVIKEKKAVLLLAQLIMSSFYRQLGEKLGVKPGGEMLEGASLAEETGAKLVLADRNIEITLKRVWRYLGFWNKTKMMVHLAAGIFSNEDIDTETIEEMKNQDQLESLMETFTKSFPEVKRRLIDERDIYLAQKIRSAEGKKIIAVVGAGHVGGIVEHISKEESLEPLMEIPPKSAVGGVIKWLIPSAILGLLVYGFFKEGAQHSAVNLFIWILVNGILSATGAAAAFGHPLTIIAAFLAAPLTSLNPFLAAGWVAGLVQALIKKPKVADFQDLPNAISTVKGFWKNPVTRILLVVVLANLGSVLGTIIAGIWIGARTVG